MKTNNEIYQELTISGSVTRDQWDFLYEQTLNQSNNNYNYVEVGSHSGGSTTSLLINIVKNNEDRKVLSIDNCIYPEVTREKFRSNLNKLGLYGPIIEHTINSQEFHPGDELFSLIFLDGDHTEPAVSTELKIFNNNLIIGGIISGHDYCSDHPGVVEAVDKFFNSDNDRYEKVECPADMWAYKKIK
tara:strand:- start:7554 stop:8114 length:561 start_codon:yes stop_codon:yes gene_type:complete